jgi:hypothetical protein
MLVAMVQHFGLSYLLNLKHILEPVYGHIKSTRGTYGSIKRDSVQCNKIIS